MMLKLLAGVMACFPCHKIRGNDTPLSEKATLDTIANKTHGSNTEWEEEIAWWIPPTVRTRGSMLQILLGKCVIRTLVVDWAARVV